MIQIIALKGGVDNRPIDEAVNVCRARVVWRTVHKRVDASTVGIKQRQIRWSRCKASPPRALLKSSCKRLDLLRIIVLATIHLSSRDGHKIRVGALLTPHLVGMGKIERVHVLVVMELAWVGIHVRRTAL